MKLIICIFEICPEFSDIATDHLLHSYKRSFNGFVVKLTEEEVHKMASG